MKRQGFAILFALISCTALRSVAATFYVDANSSNPTPPFTDWSTAATNIQDAIDVSSDGDLVLVTNGIYAAGGRSMDGVSTNRVVLDKAVTVQSVNGPFVTVIRGAGATNGPLAIRCAWLTNSASLIGFTLTAGATPTGGGPLALLVGGGVWCASLDSGVYDCVISSNAAFYGGGGAYQGTLNGCLIITNSSTLFPASGAYWANLNNCTVVSNANRGTYSCYMTNCIVYFNGVGNSFGSSIFSYCCTTPLAAGTGNFTNSPLLFSDGIRLAVGSPCINAGTNVISGNDIFGQPWNNPPSVGCAEASGPPLLTAPVLQLTGAPVGFKVNVGSIAGQIPMSYFWLKNGIMLQDNGHYSSSGTSSLTAAGILFSDGGNYQLVASNIFGVSTSAVAQLLIHCTDVACTNPVSPYSTWETAATNIQDAIDASAAGDIVLVTNGIFATGGKSEDGLITNRVSIDKPITVTSVNGYASTIIEGAWDPITTNGPSAIRCAWLTNGATLAGFTLENGATREQNGGYLPAPSQSGGGAFCTSTNAIVSNCLLQNNRGITGAGFAFGTLLNCYLTLNITDIDGGAAYGATINNCTLLSNYSKDWSPAFPTYGAGTYNCSANNSIILGNYDGWPSPNYPDEYNYVAGQPKPSYFYTCSFPLPPGTGNLDGNTSNPQFVDAFHISASSPCRAAGSPLYANGTDLDGELWGNPPSMGCEEVVISNLTGPLSVSLYANWTNNLLVNRPAYFSGTIFGRASGLSWSFGDGSTITNSSYSIFHEWSNPGNYSATFTAYNNDNPGGVSTNMLVTVLPLIPPQIQSMAWLTNGFQFQFNGQTNANYTIQYTTNLVPPVTWTTLQYLFFGTGGPQQITDPAPSDSTRFYRVLVQ